MGSAFAITDHLHLAYARRAIEFEKCCAAEKTATTTPLIARAHFFISFQLEWCCCFFSLNEIDHEHYYVRCWSLFTHEISACARLFAINLKISICLLSNYVKLYCIPFWLCSAHIFFASSSSDSMICYILLVAHANMLRCRSTVVFCLLLMNECTVVFDDCTKITKAKTFCLENDRGVLRTDMTQNEPF